MEVAIPQENFALKSHRAQQRSTEQNWFDNPFRGGNRRFSTWPGPAGCKRCGSSLPVHFRLVRKSLAENPFWRLAMFMIGLTRQHVGALVCSDSIGGVIMWEMHRVLCGLIFCMTVIIENPLACSYVNDRSDSRIRGTIGVFGLNRRSHNVGIAQSSMRFDTFHDFMTHPTRLIYY